MNVLMLDEKRVLCGKKDTATRKLFEKLGTLCYASIDDHNIRIISLFTELL